MYADASWAFFISQTALKIHQNLAVVFLHRVVDKDEWDSFQVENKGRLEERHEMINQNN